MGPGELCTDRDWREEEDATLYTITLSPIGSTDASESQDGTVRLWDIETRKGVARWPGHAERMCQCTGVQMVSE